MHARSEKTTQTKYFPYANAMHRYAVRGYVWMMCGSSILYVGVCGILQTKSLRLGKKSIDSDTFTYMYGQGGPKGWTQARKANWIDGYIL